MRAKINKNQIWRTTLLVNGINFKRNKKNKSSMRNLMTLSDQKYSELRENKQISQAIAMIKNIMIDDKKGRITKEREHYIGYAEYLSKSINTLECLRNDSTVMALLKIDKYLQFYLDELRKSKHAESEAVSALEKLKNDPHLTSLLDLEINHYIQYQINKLKKSKESFLKSRPRRIGHNTARDEWVEEIILILKLKFNKKNRILLILFFDCIKNITY